MIESLFITLIIIAFILMIVATMEKNERRLIFCILDAILWIFIMINALYVEVPFSTADNTYMEYGFAGLCLAFIMINIILAIGQFMELRKYSRLP